MIGLLASLIPMAINLASGVFSKVASDKTASKIGDLNTTMPEQAIEAEGMAREMSYMGMPGYERYKDNVDQMMSQTISQMKDVLQSPSSMIDMASRAMSATDEAYNQLAIEDTKARLGNINNYENVLTHNAGLDVSIQGQNNQIKLASIEQSAQGTKDLLQSINTGIGAGISTYGMISSLNSQEDFLKKQATFFQQGGSVDSLTPSKPAVPTFEDSPSSSPGYEKIPQMFSSPGEKSYGLDGVINGIIPPVKAGTPYSTPPFTEEPAFKEGLTTPWGSVLNPNTPVDKSVNPNGDWFDYMKSNPADPINIMFKKLGFSY